jgi:hypothetical protein
VADVFQSLSRGYAYEDFLQACQGATKNHVPPSILVRTLEMEVALGETAGMSPAASAPAPEAIRGSWSTAVAAGRIEPVRALSLRSITEFDPAQNRFRAGKWQAE